MKIINTKPLPTILSAIRKYLEYITPTYGPAGKKILISTGFSTHAVDDGQIASKEFEIEDEFENAVIEYVKEATNKTNSRVGDGTTTSAILTGAIVSETLKDIENPFIPLNFHTTAKEIQKASQEAIDKIKKSAKKIETKKELQAIAYNSFNDEKTANIIAETLFTIGKDGVVAVEDSQTAETEVEIVKGLEIEKGILSPYLVNTDKGEAVLKNPAVILVNKRIDTFLEMLPLLKRLFEAGRKEFVIIADGFSQNALDNLVVNHIKGAFQVIALEIPTGDKLENLRDIASVVGGQIIDQEVTFESIQIDELGTASKIVSGKDSTTFIGGKGNVNARVTQLKAQSPKDNHSKDKLTRRIASLLGGIAVIKVGANTDNEQKAIKAKVEDAVNATRIAFKDGVVKGGGKALLVKTSSDILNKALTAPRKQLEDNGIELLDDNVIDPVGVLVAAIETSVSIACGLITMGGIVANKRKKEDKEDKFSF